MLLILLLVLFIFSLYFSSQKNKLRNKKENIILEAEIMKNMKTTKGDKYIAVSFIKETPVAKHFLASTARGDQVKISVISDGYKRAYVNGWK